MQLSLLSLLCEEPWLLSLLCVELLGDNSVQVQNRECWVSLGWWAILVAG
jgi:hypothetical protein